MRSSSPAASRCSAALLAASVLGLCAPAPAAGQQQAQGFALERLLLAPPGNAWLVMDDLAHPAGLGGAASFSVGYARSPLEVTSRDGTKRVTVVEHEALSSVGLAVTYHRFRLHVRFASPLYVAGQSGTVDGWSYTAPVANLEQRPDSINDVRLGIDARLLGGPTDPLRLGASLELIFPSGFRYDYLTDGTYRGIARVLAAGGSGWFRWASQVGVHIRPLDEPSPGSPRGSELLFGVAGGAQLPAGAGSFLIGPEIHGATPFRAFLGSGTTALEALLTAGYRAPFPLRVKAGLGAGIDPQFGAPSWRAVLQFETQGTFD
jgi:hypothetical protein